MKNKSQGIEKIDLIIRDTRHAPFCWQEKNAIRLIRKAFQEERGNQLAFAIAIYTVLTEKASNIGSESVKLAQIEISALTGIGRTTINKILQKFEQLRLISSTLDDSSPNKFQSAKFYTLLTVSNHEHAPMLSAVQPANNAVYSKFRNRTEQYTEERLQKNPLRRTSSEEGAGEGDSDKAGYTSKTELSGFIQNNYPQLFYTTFVGQFALMLNTLSGRGVKVDAAAWQQWLLAYGRLSVKAATDCCFYTIQNPNRTLPFLRPNPKWPPTGLMAHEETSPAPMPTTPIAATRDAGFDRLTPKKTIYSRAENLAAIKKAADEGSAFAKEMYDELTKITKAKEPPT